MIGDLANEVHQTFGLWGSQRIRLAIGSCHAEIIYTVNGREMLPQKGDWRQPWSFYQTGLVAGNFHPITTGLFIRD